MPSFIWVRWPALFPSAMVRSGWRLYHMWCHRCLFFRVCLVQKVNMGKGLAIGSSVTETFFVVTSAKLNKDGLLRPSLPLSVLSSTTIPFWTLSRICPDLRHSQKMCPWHMKIFFERPELVKMCPVARNHHSLKCCGLRDEWDYYNLLKCQ